MSKILTNNCDREILKYIPKRELWINRLYFEIRNKTDYSCLTIDCGQSGPAKYRTQGDNNIQQTRFCSQKKKDRLFNKFTANNLESDNKNDLLFTIEMTHKNNSIKERHLPYNQLLLKGNGNVQQLKDANKNDGSRRNSEGTGSENE